MSYDYDDEDQGAGRVLWGRIGVFVFAGLLLFLLGRACAPDGVSPEEDSGDSGGSGDTYTVEAGDTLNEIAARFDVDPDDLADANGIDDPGDLVVGQELEIP